MRPARSSSSTSEHGSGNRSRALLLNPAAPFHLVANPVVGFQVFNDLITLNGPGFGNIGALSNLAGRNSWNGDVILGSPPPVPGSVSIGARPTLAPH